MRILEKEDKHKINELSIQLDKLKREYSKKVQEGVDRDTQKLGKYRKKKGEINNKKYNEEDNKLKLSRENNRIKNNLMPSCQSGEIPTKT